MTIEQHVQSAALGRRVVLYQIDLTEFDLGELFLAPGTDGGQVVSFGGQEYSPHPIMADGFEKTVSGSLPRPKIVVANLDNSFTALVEQNDDLQGAVVRRIRTYGRFLDSGEEPDGAAHLPIDLYQLSRKTKHTQQEIEWEMSALMDQEGVLLPGRVMVRDYCDHRYRRWNGASFDYENVTCPYVGTAYFDESGASTTAPFDRCSKRLSDGCKLRFGSTAVLPFRGFPGLARVSGV